MRTPISIRVAGIDTHGTPAFASNHWPTACRGNSELGVGGWSIWRLDARIQFGFLQNYLDLKSDWIINTTVLRYTDNFIDERIALTVSELAREAGVSRRTIRYYVSEGLLPPPRSRGRYAEYGRRHLDRLRLVGTMKAAYLPLAEIRTRLSGLSDPDVVSLLENYEQVSSGKLDVASAPLLASLQKSDDTGGTTPGELESADPAAWVRYRLEDGLEMHVLRPLHPWRERILQRILMQVRSELRDW